MLGQNSAAGSQVEATLWNFEQILSAILVAGYVD